MEDDCQSNGWRKDDARASHTALGRQYQLAIVSIQNAVDVVVIYREGSGLVAQPNAEKVHAIGSRSVRRLREHV